MFVIRCLVGLLARCGKTSVFFIRCVIRGDAHVLKNVAELNADRVAFDELFHERRVEDPTQEKSFVLVGEFDKKYFPFFWLHLFLPVAHKTW